MGLNDKKQIFGYVASMSFVDPPPGGTKQDARMVLTIGPTFENCPDCGLAVPTFDGTEPGWHAKWLSKFDGKKVVIEIDKVT